MQASPICRIGSRPKTSLVSPRVNGEPQRTRTSAFGLRFFLLFARSRRSPVVVFLRLDGYSHLLSATVSRLEMMFFCSLEPGALTDDNPKQRLWITLFCLGLCLPPITDRVKV